MAGQEGRPSSLTNIMCFTKRDVNNIKFFLSHPHQKDASAEPVSCCSAVSIYLLLKTKREEWVFWKKSIVPLTRVLAGPGWDIISAAWADPVCLLMSVLHYHSGDSIPSAGKHRGLRQTQRVRLDLCCGWRRRSTARFAQPGTEISLRKQVPLQSFWHQTRQRQQRAELTRLLLIRQAKQICSYHLPCLQLWQDDRWQKIKKNSYHGF